MCCLMIFFLYAQTDGTSTEIVRLARGLTSVEQRDKAVARVMEEIRKKNIFVTLKGWRHEVHCISIP